jgi:hypothetical protein
VSAGPLPGRGVGQAPREIASRQTRRVLLASLVVTAALYVIPGGELVAYPLLLLSTFVHELGHGLTAVLVGGRFVELQVFADGSGVAVSATSGGRLSRAVVAAGGLVGPAVAAAVGFTVGRSARGSRLVLLVGSVLLVVTALIWVRSLVGWLVVAGLVLLSGGIALAIRQHHWSQLWLVFLSVQLGLSVFSRGDYLFAAGASTGAGFGPSDSAAIANALAGPYWFWGGVCGLFSVAVLGYGAWLFLRSALPVEDAGDG